MSLPPIALLTDFGLKDNYVAAMKGVLLSSLPDVKLIDITHDVPAQNVPFGAYQLMTSYKNFPAGTLFVCVVDPGVGTDRKILYVKTKTYQFIAPDNGLLSWILEKEKPEQVVSLRKPSNQKVSQTFHGRDIMAPMAAKILGGASPATLGDVMARWVTLPFPAVKKQGARWVGTILAEDGFGNLITNIRTDEVRPFAEESKLWLEVGAATPPIRGLKNSYQEVDAGQLLAIGGSTGFVEVSVRDGSAARLTGLKQGEEIVLHYRV